jgi:AraC-like DNA-binding protein
MHSGSDIRISSTGALPLRDRFPYWADVVTQAFVPLECDTPDRAHFAGTIRHRTIGCIAVADVCATAQRARRTAATIARAPSDEQIVVLHLTGPCRVGQGAHVAELEPGDGAMVGADQGYAFEFVRPFRQLVLKVPRFLLTGDRNAGPAFRLGTGPGKLLRHLALSVLDDLAQLSREEEAGIERAFGELLRAGAAPRADHAGQALHGLQRYAAAAEFIRQNLGDCALTPHMVAAHLGISVRSLGRVFAERGATIERVIWRTRLDAAKRDLADPRLRAVSITQIAFSWAFNDAAHFSRSFSQAYGMTPTRFRELNLPSG